MSFTEQQIERAWSEARKAANLDADMFRLDPCGALIMRDKYGYRDNPYGWEIDHIYPISNPRSDDNPENLRAMHYLNNVSKGDDFPSYIAEISYDGYENVKNRRSLKVNKTKYERLKTIYNL